MRFDIWRRRNLIAPTPPHVARTFAQGFEDLYERKVVFQAPVVQSSNNTIHWINLWITFQRFAITYPPDSDFFPLDSVIRFYYNWALDSSPSCRWFILGWGRGHRERRQVRCLSGKFNSLRTINFAYLTRRFCILCVPIGSLHCLLCHLKILSQWRNAR